MGYPTPKQQKLIEAIEGMWFSQDEALAPKYDDYCRERGLDRSTFRAVKSYLDRYKEDFLEEQKRRRDDYLSMKRNYLETKSRKEAEEDRAQRRMLRECGIDPESLDRAKQPRLSPEMEKERRRWMGWKPEVPDSLISTPCWDDDAPDDDSRIAQAPAETREEEREDCVEYNSECDRCGGNACDPDCPIYRGEKGPDGTRPSVRINSRKPKIDPDDFESRTEYDYYPEEF